MLYYKATAGCGHAPVHTLLPEPKSSPLQDSRLDTAHRGNTTQTGEPWSIGRSDPPHIVPR